MILTELDITDVFYNYIKSKGLDEMVSGSLYRTPRPINSMLEDIVISVLTSGNGQIQPFVLNINIYVPDIRRGKEFILNEERLAPLMRKGADILSHGRIAYPLDGTEFDIIFDLESQKIYEVNGADFHAINHRVRVNVCTE